MRETCSSPIARARTASRGQRGQVAVILALSFVVLLIAIGLGIDGGRLFVEGTHIQKAADEAALSASVAASSGDDAAVTGTAQLLVDRNLHLPSGVTDNVSTTLTSGPNQQVNVRVTENNFPLVFGPLVGIRSVPLVREATAKYSPALPMGNPSNTLGDTGDPSSRINTYQPPLTDGLSPTLGQLPQNLKLSINGPDVFTESGDPYSPLYTLSDDPFLSTNGMTPLMKNPWRAAANPAAANPTFAGYDYKVTVPVSSTGTTYIQVYDAETCAGAQNGAGTPFGDLLGTTAYGLPYPGNANKTLTYPPSGAFPYGTSTADGTAYPTYYSLYWVDPSGARGAVPSGNITTTLPSNGSGQQAPFLGTGSPIMIAPGEAVDNGTGGACYTNALKPFTKRWYTLAAVDATKAGDYIVNVNTCLAQHPYDATNDRGLRTYTYSDSSGTHQTQLPNCQGTEINNFALRAVTIDSTQGCLDSYGLSTTADGLNCQYFPRGSSPQQPTVSGLGRVSIFVGSGGNVSSANKTLIYLAKVEPKYKGKWLVVKMFDPGDMAGSSSMQIVRPDGSYAPFEWYSQLLDGGVDGSGTGTTFNTSLQNNGSRSLITSYPATGINYYTPTPTPTNTPVPPTATSTPTNTPTSTPNATDTAASAATGTAASAATGTANAGATGTANAGATGTSIANATGYANATGTSVANATANSNSTSTAYAWATGTTVANATSTAYANATGTAYAATCGSSGGIGLLGQYYDDSNNPGSPLTGPLKLPRIDPTVNFTSWGQGSPPDPALAAGNGAYFSVRWTGEVQPASTGTYAFQTVSDDGVRLFINNRIVISDWSPPHSPTTDPQFPLTANLPLTAGQKYSIEMDYFQAGGGAVAQLYWTPPGQPSPSIIPQSALYPPFPASCSVVPTANPATQTAAAGNLFSTQTAVAGQTATAYALTVVAQQTQSAQQTQTAAPGATSSAIAQQTQTSQQTQTASAGATSSAIAQQTQTTQQTQTAGSTATAASNQTATAAPAATTAAAQTATAASGQTATALAQPTNTNTPVPPTNTATPSPTITPGGGNTAMLLPVRTPVQLVAGIHLINPAVMHAARGAQAMPAAPLATPTQPVPDYAYPPADSSGNYVCPSPDKSIQTGVSPPGASAVGQTVPEDNPFDPHIHPGCLPSSEYRVWPSVNAPATPLWIAPPPGQEYQAYNLSWQGPSQNNPNYRPYNGRWVYLYTKIPDNYDTTYNPLDASGHPLNPNPGYWYVQYLNHGAGQITDRTTWEVSVIDTPPHLVN